MAKMATRAQKRDVKNRGDSIKALVKPMKWFAGLLAGGLVAVALVFAGVWLFSINTDNVFPINRVEITGQQFTQAKDIHGALRAIEDRGFFTMDMQQAEQVMQEIAWIKKVQLRKIWPDTLQIVVREHKPFAYWGKDGVVSDDGEVFYPNQLPEANWVSLNGPDSLAKDLTQLLQNYQQQLQQQKLVIQKMDLSERGSIDLTLQGDIKVYLGKVHVEQRLERLLQYFEVLTAQNKQQLAYLDMRYQNGMAAKWIDGETQTSSENGQSSRGI
ncbi:MAG: FtsQ-type POTRA domain-containing protein [Kangiellaceae bacterium]|nr:FtsQ-type POTRA domain-containing protein [Kangiellaceae bacterium]